jgi:acyl-CoA synthetase (AMP-forming)/AMP-acid ligase II
MPKFDAPGIWKRFQAPERDLTLFMAVPTIYSRLIEIWNSMSPEDRKKATESCNQFRLQVSGSAALPTPLKEKWKTISGGKVLLERYGMTETGMIISCGMQDHERVDGHVGLPMPGQQVRLWDADAKKDVSDQQETPGEIQVRGDLIFKEYWKLPEKTKEEFTEDGWFKTGDIAVRTEGTTFYRIQGRSSVDQIKTGSEKVSALEVESIMLALPYVKEVAVVGVDDERWGQVVAAVVVLKDKEMHLDIKKLREDLKKEAANYKIPQKLKIMDEIPRNQMHKINKKDLVKVAFPVE